MPPGANSSPVIRNEYLGATLDVFEAALVSLNVTSITASQLLEAVREEQKRRAEEALLKRMYSLNTYLKIAYFICNALAKDKLGTVYACSVDENGKPTKEYRRKLRDLTLKAFPDGKIPYP
jgi:hypothetical protein